MSFVDLSKQPMLPIHFLLLFLPLFSPSDASVSMNDNDRATAFMFHHMISDAAQMQATRYDSLGARDGVYFGTISNMYRSITRSPVRITNIHAPIIRHKGLYDAIKGRRTFRPTIIYNKLVSFYAWLPHVPGAVHIAMTYEAWLLIGMLVLFNPKFVQLYGTLTFEELRMNNGMPLVEYPKNVAPRINTVFQSNLFPDMYSTIITVLNFMAVYWPNSKAFFASFRWYFVNSRIEIIAIPGDMKSMLHPFALLHPDIPIAIKETEGGVHDAVLMHPEAAKSLVTMVIAREGDEVALLHLTPNSRTHPTAAEFFNANAHKLIDKHFSITFKLGMHLLADFKGISH